MRLTPASGSGRDTSAVLIEAHLDLRRAVIPLIQKDTRRAGRWVYVEAA